MTFITGYISGGKHLFGDRYNVLVKHAREEQKRHAKQLSKSEDSLSNAKNRLKTSKTLYLPPLKVKPPFKPIKQKPAMYFPKAFQHSVSPYSMKNDQPGKFFISGYTGFVPRAREHMGELLQIVFSFKEKKERKVSCSVPHKTARLLLAII